MLQNVASVCFLLFALFNGMNADLPPFPGWSSSGDGGEKKHNNGMLAAFVVLFILFAVVNVFLLFRRKAAFAPVIAIHSNRSDKANDFTAFTTAPHIADTLESLHEEIVWADVSLRIPVTSTLLLILLPAVFGIIITVVVTRVVPADKAAFAAPVLLILLIPAIYHFVLSYKQIINGDHYTHINALTPRGAYIIHQGMCGSKSQYFAYEQMRNVHTITSGEGTGNVFFAEEWKREDVENTHAHNGRLYKETNKEWKKHGVGFVNIVQPMEVQALIIARNNGGLPPTDAPPIAGFAPAAILHNLSQGPTQGFSLNLPGVSVSF